MPTRLISIAVLAFFASLFPLSGARAEDRQASASATEDAAPRRLRFIDDDGDGINDLVQGKGDNGPHPASRFFRDEPGSIQNGIHRPQGTLLHGSKGGRAQGKK
ncbi:hypothetical protein [Chlorobium sp. N1]|uniref:hypothetical protein n=1 Tax=Chlorobium sp. N1 TaxID=2491138 RepID=UPI00103998AE|nr:hypothetical protein [Chlorobium sp. N1]TCD47335.1 hypothetical protein E0L29_08595 [Chlorobium sp. N1]